MYIAARSGYTDANSFSYVESVEGAARFRPDRIQIIEIGYEFRHLNTGTYGNDNVLAMQLVTSFDLAFTKIQCL